MKGSAARGSISSEPLHIITNFALRGGAETMLARYAGSSPGRGRIISLMHASPELFAGLARNPLEVTALGAGSAAGLAGSVASLRAIILHTRPGAIICWMYHAHVVGTLAAFAARYDGPVIWNVRQALDDFNSLSLSARTAFRTAKLLRFRPDGVIYNSRRALEQHMIRGYSSGGVVIPNGVALPPVIREQEGRPGLIGIAAHFHPKKDYPNFIAAAALVAAARPDVQFVAAGNGVTPDNQELGRLIGGHKQLAGRIRLLGPLSDMASFYRSLDLLALSSRTEGFPNVLVEAMAHGVPCVSTDVGDASTAIADTGEIVPSQDPQALAAAMARMLDLPDEEYGRRCRAARKRVEENYSLEASVLRYDAYIAECAARRPRVKAC